MKPLNKYAQCCLTLPSLQQTIQCHRNHQNKIATTVQWKVYVCRKQLKVYPKETELKNRGRQNMRKLLNTLYITQELAFVSLDGENVVISLDQKEQFRIPLCNIENIVCFNYMGCSPALMGKCADNGVNICFIRPSGRFLARVSGSVKGSVHLRRAQFEQLTQPEVCLTLSQNVVATKLHNARANLARGLRDHGDKIDKKAVKNVINLLTINIDNVYQSTNADSVRGYEGESARMYFMVFNELILRNKDVFKFESRTKRPPLDRINAMLSYLYTILTLDVQSALESVGLDPYIGFLHTDRAGRASLACDLVEELRTYMVERLVLSMINLMQIDGDDFLIKEGGGVIMTDDCRKKILKAWQTRKNDTITHPVIKEKISIGLIPYVQAMLLAKFIRGESIEYLPFTM